jgi:hypothetical protein
MEILNVAMLRPKVSSIEDYTYFFRRCVMKRILAVCMTTAFIMGTASMGVAGQGMKADSAEENVPENIQRSTPSGESSLPDGSGPGSRADQLTEMGDVSSQDASGKSKSDQAARDLKNKSKKAPISGQSSSEKNH